jgi:hypothetical protein
VPNRVVKSNSSGFGREVPIVLTQFKIRWVRPLSDVALYVTDSRRDPSIGDTLSSIYSVAASIARFEKPSERKFSSFQRWQEGLLNGLSLGELKTISDTGCATFVDTWI